MEKFKIIGTNAQLKAFLADCEVLDIPVSSLNSFFRDDYEHCLMPCYAYDENQPYNTKLQTLAADSYKCEMVLDLTFHYQYALVLLNQIEFNRKSVNSIIDKFKKVEI